MIDSKCRRQCECVFTIWGAIRIFEFALMTVKFNFSASSDKESFRLRDDAVSK